MQNNDQKRSAGEENTAADKKEKVTRETAERKKPAPETAGSAGEESPPLKGDEEKAASLQKSEGDKTSPQVAPSRKVDSPKAAAGGESPAPDKAAGTPPGERPVNRLREFRIERMMSKAELARKAGLSVLTVARIEGGYGCRMDTKRKILKALGLRLSDRRRVFEDD